MAKKPAPDAAPDAAPQPDAPRADPRDLKTKIADAVAAVDDYVYVDVAHEGQRYVAWRSRNGVVHVENRGE